MAKYLTSFTGLSGTMLPEQGTVSYRRVSVQDIEEALRAGGVTNLCGSDEVATLFGVFTVKGKLVLRTGDIVYTIQKKDGNKWCPLEWTIH